MSKDWQISKNCCDKISSKRMGPKLVIEIISHTLELQMSSCFIPYKFMKRISQTTWIKIWRGIFKCWMKNKESSFDIGSNEGDGVLV